MPFFVMEQSGSSSKTNSSSQNNRNISESYVRKLMLDTWSRSIFSEIKYRLQNSAMKIIFSERIGEAFDSLLVVGVRESYGELFIL
jgi:cullin-5